MFNRTNVDRNDNTKKDLRVTDRIKFGYSVFEVFTLFFRNIRFFFFFYMIWKKCFFRKITLVLTFFVFPGPSRGERLFFHRNGLRHSHLVPRACLPIGLDGTRRSIYSVACGRGIRAVAERRGRRVVALHQRRGDRAGRAAVPHREGVGTVQPDAGQPDQPRLAAGRLRAVQRAAADIRGPGTARAAGSADGVAAATASVVTAAATAATVAVGRVPRDQPDRHRRTVDGQERGPPPVAVDVQMSVRRPAPGWQDAGAGTRPIRHRAQGAHVRAAGLPGPQGHGQADQGEWNTPGAYQYRRWAGVAAV